MFKKIIAFAISFCLIFEQSGFAQVAAGMHIPGYLASLMPPEIFNPAQLRAISLDPASEKLSLFLDAGDTKLSQAAEGQTTAAELYKYFQIGLRLPNKLFWVNLRPDSPKDIIDPYLEKTDVGRILLAADLQLKKDLALFTSPDRPEGKRYWDKLYAKAQSLYGQADLEIPTFTRPWIVPGEIIIRESRDGAYIYKAGLLVMLEQEYLKDSPFFIIPDSKQKEMNAYSSELLRAEILPKLTREVNASKRYAPLRQVYYSLVLAQWFKQKAAGQANVDAQTINTKDLTGLTAQAPWSKDTYYGSYKKSFSQGEYNKEEQVSTSSGLAIRSYCSGGVNINTDGGQALAVSSGQRIEDFFATVDGLVDIRPDVIARFFQNVSNNSRIINKDKKKNNSKNRNRNNGGMLEISDLQKRRIWDLFVNSMINIDGNKRLSGSPTNPRIPDIDFNAPDNLVELERLSNLQKELTQGLADGGLALESLAMPVAQTAIIATAMFFGLFFLRGGHLSSSDVRKFLYMTTGLGVILFLAYALGEFNAMLAGSGIALFTRDNNENTRQSKDGGMEDKVFFSDGNRFSRAQVERAWENLRTLEEQSPDLFGLLVWYVHDSSGGNLSREIINALAAPGFDFLDDTVKLRDIYGSFIRDYVVLDSQGNPSSLDAASHKKTINAAVEANTPVNIFLLGPRPGKVTVFPQSLNGDIFTGVTPSGSKFAFRFGQLRSMEDLSIPADIDIIAIYSGAINVTPAPEDTELKVRPPSPIRAQLGPDDRQKIIAGLDTLSVMQQRPEDLLAELIGQGLSARPENYLKVILEKLGILDVMSRYITDMYRTNMINFGTRFRVTMLGLPFSEMGIVKTRDVSGNEKDEVKHILVLNENNFSQMLTNLRSMLTQLSEIPEASLEQLKDGEITTIKDYAEAFSRFARELTPRGTNDLLEGLQLTIAYLAYRESRAPTPQEAIQSILEYSNIGPVKPDRSIVGEINEFNKDVLESVRESKSADEDATVLTDKAVEDVVKHEAMKRLLSVLATAMSDKLAESSKASSQSRDGGDVAVTIEDMKAFQLALKGDESWLSESVFKYMASHKIKFDGRTLRELTDSVLKKCIEQNRTDEETFWNHPAAEKEVYRSLIKFIKDQKVLRINIEKTLEARERAGKSNDGGSTNTGGIDFRALPLSTQPGMTPGIMMQPAIDLKTLRALAQQSRISDLDKEWNRIEKQISGKTMPYEKMKEYIAVCCERKASEDQLNRIVQCLTDILRLEEACAVLTSSQMKELLVIVEAIKT